MQTQGFEEHEPREVCGRHNQEDHAPERWAVSCALKPKQPTFHDNSAFARICLHSLKRGKLRYPILRERYADVIQEWMAKDYIEEVPEEAWKLKEGLP